MMLHRQIGMLTKKSREWRKKLLAARDLGMSEICPKRTEAAAVLLLGWRLRATQASSETAPRFRKYESCSGERVR